MTICLSEAEIDAALPRVGAGLRKYLWLQEEVAGGREFYREAGFRRRYNHFYRVRRGAGWQEAYYGLMGRAQRERLEFPVVLAELRKATGRWEASFASKLVATLDTSMPIIDAMVLKNLGLRLPLATAARRESGICDVYGRIVSMFAAFLGSDSGGYLVASFVRTYPDGKISRVKMLDLVLWQKRGTAGVVVDALPF